MKRVGKRPMARHSQREGFPHEWAVTENNMPDSALCLCLACANLIKAPCIHHEAQLLQLSRAEDGLR